MQRKKEHAIRDLFYICISIAFAAYVVHTGVVHTWGTALSNLSVLGIFLAGTLFTSVFTTAPAIVILGELSQTNPIALVVFVGALGAMAGDYVIFRFVKTRISDDMKYLMTVSKIRRLPAIFRTKLFHYLTPLVGALIIASPLPDEFGLALLGLSKMKDKNFFPVSFLMNALGILGIALVANAIMW